MEKGIDSVSWEGTAQELVYLELCLLKEDAGNLSDGSTDSSSSVRFHELSPASQVGPLRIHGTGAWILGARPTR